MGQESRSCAADCWHTRVQVICYCDLLDKHNRANFEFLLRLINVIELLSFRHLMDEVKSQETMWKGKCWCNLINEHSRFIGLIQSMERCLLKRKQLWWTFSLNVFDQPILVSISNILLPELFWPLSFSQLSETPQAYLTAARLAYEADITNDFIQLGSGCDCITKASYMTRQVDGSFQQVAKIWKSFNPWLLDSDSG